MEKKLIINSKTFKSFTPNTVLNHLKNYPASTTVEQNLIKLDKSDGSAVLACILVGCFNAINNILNSKTNIDALDRLTAAFNELFNTAGITGLDHKFNIVGQSFAVYNAIGLGVEREEKRKKKKTEGATVNLSEDVQFKLDNLNDKIYKITEFMFHLIKHYYSSSFN